MDKDRYREEGYLCPVTPRIQEKSQDIAGDAEDAREAAEACFRWVRDMYCWDITRIRGADALLQRDGTRAMSFDKSNLLVSLLRAQDLPARFRFIRCTFHNRYTDRTDTAIHAPVEVLLDGGWVVADPAFGVHTERFIPVASFGEETWGDVKSEEIRAALPRMFVWGYNYVFRFLHPTLRQLRKEIRACQDR